MEQVQIPLQKLLDNLGNDEPTYQKIFEFHAKLLQIQKSLDKCIETISEDHGTLEDQIADPRERMAKAKIRAEMTVLFDMTFSK